jgi:spermidine/putrescine transport system permease protein
VTRRVWRRLADHWVLAVALLVVLYLIFPVGVMAAMSFRDARRAAPYTMDSYRFTWEHWARPCGAPGLCGSLLTSVQVGLIATLVATVLGTPMALALVRHRFRGRGAVNALVLLPVASPEVTMGASLLALFVATGFPLGFWSVVIAHVLFCMSFVVVTVKARLAGLDPGLEEAAMDLYANRWQVLRRVTLPLLRPGILAAALLSFALSFDDFVITNFNAGAGVQTFPMFVWGAAQRGIPAQVNVIGTAMFLLALLIVLAGQQRRGSCRTRR